jgi:hypothetical protein
MAAAMDCEPSYLTKLLKPGDHNIKASTVVKLFNAILEKDSTMVKSDGVTKEWIMFGGPRIQATELTPLQDAPILELTDHQFKQRADLFAIECRRRGYKAAARALMDVADGLSEPELFEKQKNTASR